MIKKMLYDRKGVAIELAILMTAVCLAVTTIVLSTALLQYENKVQAEQRMEENIILEQIAEEWLKDTENDNLVYEGYICVIEPGKMLEIFKTDEAGNRTGNPVLTITVENDVITKWTKG
ncbi:MAG: hypothetical protein E7435_06895 [Ruminococcaceae bacterium]|nr:hypothetical protein [Oscillospiraceae bacterium]